MNRRQFLSSTSLGTLSALHSTQAAATAEGWIDAHVHVWTPDTDRYPLAEGYTPADMQPPSFTPEQLLALATPHGVGRILLIQMSFYTTDNRYMLDCIAAQPEVFRGVAIIDHQAADTAETMRQLKQRGVTGFRLYADAEKTRAWLTDTAMDALWEQAAQNQQAICLLANPDALPAIDTLCQRHPDTPVVIDHFARIGMKGPIDPDQVRALTQLARHPKVHVKTSAFYALGEKKPPYTDLSPLIRTLRDSFGAQRLMWATDCPYQHQGEHSYAASISLIRDHLDFLSKEEKRAILRDTAATLFFAPI
jgi:predicted TIM-barrel fold metal-dependent hydrolase